MQTFEERIESLTKITITSSSTPSQNDITEYLQDGVKDFLRKLSSVGRGELLLPYTTTTSVTDGNGVEVESRLVLSVLRGDGTIMNPAEEIPVSLKGRAADSDSLFFRSKYNPCFYREGKKVYILPTPTTSTTEGGEVHHVKFDTDVHYASVGISNFTKDSEYLIVLYASAMSCLSAATDIHNNPPTAPVYIQPSTSVSFTDVDTEFTDEDPEMIDKRLAKIDKELLEIDKNIQVAKAKYQEEVDEYSRTLELNQNKYKWWMEQYTRLMSQYSSGILGATKQEAPKKEESPKRERRRR